MIERLRPASSPTAGRVSGAARRTRRGDAQPGGDHRDDRAEANWVEIGRHDGPHVAAPNCGLCNRLRSVGANAITGPATSGGRSAIVMSASPRPADAKSPASASARIMRSRSGRSATWMAMRIGRSWADLSAHRSAVGPRGDGDLRRRRCAGADEFDCNLAADAVRPQTLVDTAHAGDRLAVHRNEDVALQDPPPAGPAGSTVTTMAARRRCSPSRAGRGTDCKETPIYPRATWPLSR